MTSPVHSWVIFNVKMSPDFARGRAEQDFNSKQSVYQSEQVWLS